MSTPDPDYVAIRQQIEDATGTDPHADVTSLVEALHARYLDLVRGGSTGRGLPYPSPTDPLMEGADAIRALAEAINPWLYPQASGNQSFGTAIAAGSYDTRAVTFPSGRFTVGPTVVTSPVVTNPNSRTSAVTSVTATGFTCTMGNTATTS